jgi:transposase InsO family protein
LEIGHSTYYYEPQGRVDDSEILPVVEAAFTNNRRIYGSWRIKKVLACNGIHISKRTICRIMKQQGWESAYANSRYRVHANICNEAAIPNELARYFDNQEQNAVIVSVLTYARVYYQWHYIYILLDLLNREIIGFSAGAKKDAQLVYDACATVNIDLGKIQMFHTDRGSEFNNQLIDEILDTFQIRRSLSLKGCPYDNAVAESTFRIIKAEFMYGRNFGSIERLRMECADYVHWFNNIRIHGSLGYLSPCTFKAKTL